MKNSTNKAYRFLKRWFDAARRACFRGRRLSQSECEWTDISLYRSALTEVRKVTPADIWSGSGLGVYQGEVVVIQRWVQPGQPLGFWTVEPVNDYQLSLLDNAQVQTFLCLASRIVNEKLFFPETPDSQKTDIAKLDNCPFCHHGQQVSPLSGSYKEEDDSASIPAQTKLPREQNPICQLCQKLAAKYSYGNSSTT